MKKGKYYESSERGKMHGLGNVQHDAQSIRALTAAPNESSNPTQETTNITNAYNAYDDAAAAVICDTRQSQDNQDTNAPFSASRPNMTETQIKANPANSKSPTFVVYSDPSNIRLKTADEIKVIYSFGGFLLGVHEKPEKFAKKSEFNLQQILDVEKRMAEDHETLELYRFTLIRVREEAFRALRCQGNIGPQRALHLLRESIERKRLPGRL
jgi:hypothetical protein